MLLRTDYAPSPVGQRSISRQAAPKFVLNIGLALVTLLAIFSGLTGSQADLEKMGVYLGPNHF